MEIVEPMPSSRDAVILYVCSWWYLTFGYSQPGFLWKTGIVFILEVTSPCTREDNALDNFFAAKIVDLYECAFLSGVVAYAKDFQENIHVEVSVDGYRQGITKKARNTRKARWNLNQNLIHANIPHFFISIALSFVDVSNYNIYKLLDEVVRWWYTMCSVAMCPGALLLVVYHVVINFLWVRQITKELLGFWIRSKVLNMFKTAYGTFI